MTTASPAYILPPVEADSINTTTVPFGITDAMLTSSTVAETDYTAWNAATAYTAGDFAIRTTATTHAIYLRLISGTTATAPEDDATNWVRVSATNRWKMFDMLSASPTTGASPLTVVLEPGRISGLAIIGAVADSVTITLVDGVDTVYSETVSLDQTIIENWDDYFFAEFAQQANVVKLDLPTYSDGVLTVTFTGTGTLSVEKLIVGTATEVGVIQSGARVRRRSFTAVERDDFGELTGITRRKSIPLVSQTLFIDKGLARRVRMALDLAKSCPCVFIGFDDDTDAYAELLTFVALCNDYEINLDHPETAVINTELEGI